MIQAREVAHVDIVLWTVADFMAINIDIVFTIDGNGAARFRNDAADHGHGCGFSSAIVAQQNGNLILYNVQRQIIDGHMFPSAEFFERFG